MFSITILSSSISGSNLDAKAFASKLLPEMDEDKIVILNMCGRGDKDLEAVLPLLDKRGLL